MGAARLLPYLPLLVCPLLMVACLLGMRGMGRQDRRVSTEDGSPEDAASHRAPERVAALEREVAELRARLDGADHSAGAAADPPIQDAAAAAGVAMPESLRATRGLAAAASRAPRVVHIPPSDGGRARSPRDAG